MAEFIGSRISLISKRDIRYVGTLHEISSENSTVALEQVVSFGTEGRRPEDEVLPSDNVYEYIVFRGSDVKDLRIEETPKENKPPKPQVPDDPAILGSARRSTPLSTSQAPVQQQQQQQQQSQDGQPKQPQQPSQPQQSSQFQQNQQQQLQQPQQGQQLNQHQPLPRLQQHPYPYFYPPPPNQRFGPQGFPLGPGFPGIPYGGPPGWYPPPGQAFHHPPPGQFYAQQLPIGSVAQQQAAHGPPGPAVPPPQQPASVIATINKDQETRPQKETPEKPVATVKLPSASTTPGPTQVPLSTPPPPPTGTKPDVAAALAPPAPVGNKENPTSPKPVPTGPKNGRIVPVIPRHSPAIKPPVPVNGKLPTGNSAPEKPQISTKPENSRPVQVATKSLEDANRDAKAAVAAAMAKLPPPPGQKKETNGESAVDNLTRKVNEMRTNDNTRFSRQPGTGGFVTGYRGGRGGYRGGRPQAEQQVKKVEVPTTDYDFASANAKFNKQDLVKEAIATGSPIGLPVDAGNLNGTSTESSGHGARKGSEPSVIIPPVASYNKSSSFFDNISSESKDRDDGGGQKLGGREFRSEEQKKNFETFGQGSVDNGYRGGYRGRGRGRGYGRPRGGYSRGGRGVMRGGQGATAGAIHAES